MLPTNNPANDDRDTPTVSTEADRLGSECQRIQALFGHGSHRGLRDVQVSVEDDRVLLSGTVSSYYLKQMAQERVRQACPHVKLSNDVVVQPQS